ncbi:MAG: redox-sensing transcriptional repressor Rex [Chloroflexi bacterium]|nr:redox-sensing transcriptional repressor Rex [Chloroflexota bacterium]
MAQQKIPEVVVDRLPTYVRALTLLREEGISVVSSQELGVRLRVTPAQIRKDLSYFGRFGKQGRGYNIDNLIRELRSILGLTKEWPMALVGAGQLGQAILRYTGFVPEGFRVVAAFDTDKRQIGRKIGPVVVQDVAELPQTVVERNVDIGIVAVPSATAQGVIDTLVRSGIRAILNYAPMSPHIPENVLVREVDPVVALQSMTFYLKLDEKQREKAAQ